MRSLIYPKTAAITSYQGSHTSISQENTRLQDPQCLGVPLCHLKITTTISVSPEKCTHSPCRKESRAQHDHACSALTHHYHFACELLDELLIEACNEGELREGANGDDGEMAMACRGGKARQRDCFFPRRKGLAMMQDNRGFKWAPNPNPNVCV